MAVRRRTRAAAFAALVGLIVLFLLVLRDVARYRLYDKGLFYLGLAAVVAWWALILGPIALVFAKRRVPKTIFPFATKAYPIYGLTLVISGIFGATALDGVIANAVGYPPGVLALAYFLIPFAVCAAFISFGHLRSARKNENPTG